MDDEQLIFEVTDKGMRAFIEAFEYALDYEPINTSKMNKKQLNAYFEAIRSKADIENFPEREERFKSFLGVKLLEALNDQARWN